MKIKVSGELEQLDNGKFKVEFEAENEGITDYIFAIKNKIQNKGQSVEYEYIGVSDIGGLKDLPNKGKMTLNDFQYGEYDSPQVSRTYRYSKTFRELGDARDFVDQLEENVQRLASDWRYQEFDGEKFTITAT